LQQKVTQKYNELKHSIHKKILNGDTVRKYTQHDMRILVCKWVGDSWDDIILNHKQLLINAWKNTGLTLKIDESEDETALKYLL